MYKPFFSRGAEPSLPENFFDSARKTAMQLTNIFSRGAEPSLPENFFDSARKTAMQLTCKITLPDLPHPVIISKNPRFRTLYLTRQYEYRLFV